MSARRAARFEITVTELTDEGLGIGSVIAPSGDPREVLVRQALPGETVAVVVRKRRGGIWYAETEQVLHAAGNRIEAACPVAERCGGCAMQHLDYAAQLAHKASVVMRLIEAEGIVAERIRAPVTGPRLYYRHKARLGVRQVDGELLLGFRESFGNRVVRMTRCPTLAQPLSEVLPELRATLAGLSIADRIPQVELAAGDRGMAFVIRHLAPLSDTDHAALETFGRSPERAVYLQPGGYDSIRALEDGGPVRPLHYANPDFGLLFRFLPTEFTQVNPYVNRLLVRAALLALEARPGDRALDFFCGLGNFSLALARKGVSVLGLESAESAVRRARENATLNGLSGLAEFAVQDLYDASGASLGGARLMLLDPPRSGAGPNLAQWVKDPALERIAYVSCNPKTFATDAVTLVTAGFRLAEIGVFDMFPHTAHIETLGLFVRSR